MPKDDAEEFNKMFRDWDADRGNGLPVGCGVTDTTFGSQVDATVVFATPPSFTYYGTQFMLVSFGLKEV